MRAIDANLEEHALLIFDHHSPRDIIDPVMLWDSHKIVLFMLPPHSSSLTQLSTCLRMLNSKNPHKSDL